MHLPLHTLSSVLTCDPSSMVWRLKSISGTGRLLVTARMALSMYWSWSTPWLAMVRCCCCCGCCDCCNCCCYCGGGPLRSVVCGLRSAVWAIGCRVSKDERGALLGWRSRCSCRWAWSGNGRRMADYCGRAGRTEWAEWAAAVTPCG